VLDSATSDTGHVEVIEALLAMAEAERRPGDAPRALYLLETVERRVGTLPERHQRLRVLCLRQAGLHALA
jgi:hypothetical protein